MRESVLLGSRRARLLGRKGGLKIREFSGGQGAHEGFYVYFGRHAIVLSSHVLK